MFEIRNEIKIVFFMINSIKFNIYFFDKNSLLTHVKLIIIVLFILTRIEDLFHFLS